MKSLQKYSEEISQAQPFQLVDILTEMTKDYAEVCDLMIPIERAKMTFWLKNKKLESEKPISDKTIEMMWMAKDDENLNGVIQKRMELYKKALEKLMSNVKAIIRQREIEARNIQ